MIKVKGNAKTAESFEPLPILGCTICVQSSSRNVCPPSVGNITLGRDGQVGAKASKFNVGVSALDGKENRVRKGKIHFMISTGRLKKGLMYLAEGNMQKVGLRESSSGKVVIILKNPNFQIVLTKAPTEALNRFLELLKTVYHNPVEVDEAKLSQLQTFLKTPLPSYTHTIKGKLPKTFMESWEKLKICECSLTHLPEQLLKLKAITALHINNCQLVEVSSAMAELRKLKYLDLSCNKIQKLPPNIATMTQLFIVNLSTNSFSVFPDALCSLTLSSFEVRENAIVQIPMQFIESHLPSLYSLDLSNNKIRTLPGNFGQLAQLRILKINNNAISFLPRGFESLQLKTCDFSANTLLNTTKMPSKITWSFPSLRELSARRCTKENKVYDRLRIPGDVLKLLKSRIPCCQCSLPCNTSFVPFIKLLDCAVEEITGLSTGRKVPICLRVCSVTCARRIPEFRNYNL